MSLSPSPQRTSSIRGMVFPTSRTLLLVLAGAMLALAGCADPVDTYPLPGEHGGASTELGQHNGSNPNAPVFGVDISLWSGEITDNEVACWYAQGVRHVIAGTQNPRITRQQLDMALAGGMSVDAYVYLHWDQDMNAQVEKALATVDKYPIGRLWLDVEQDPAGRSPAQLTALIQEAVDACGSTECGIYTAAWWWRPYMADSDAFSDVPLWYAHYDLDPDMSTWEQQRFGGWDTPTGKQFNEIYFCGIDTDKNTIHAIGPRPAPPTPPEPAAGTPRTPTGLYPDNGVRIRTDAVRMLSDLAVSATGYEFEVESYSSGQWRGYYTFRTAENASRFNPVFDNRVYRWRVRANNASGYSPWSDWAIFEFGVASQWPEPDPGTTDPDPEPEPDPGTTDPDPEPEPDPGTTDPDPEPEPDPGTTDPDPEPEPDPGTTDPDPEPTTDAPTGLLPADGAQISSGSVTFSWNEITDATTYEVAIESMSGSGSWTPYFTYTTSGVEKTFWPASQTRYRWKVRANVAGSWTSWSSWASFDYGP